MKFHWVLHYNLRGSSRVVRAQGIGSIGQGAIPAETFANFESLVEDMKTRHGECSSFSFFGVRYIEASERPETWE